MIVQKHNNFGKRRILISLGATGLKRSTALRKAALRRAALRPGASVKKMGTNSRATRPTKAAPKPQDPSHIIVRTSYPNGAFKPAPLVKVATVNAIIKGFNPVLKTTTIEQLIPLLRKTGIASSKEFFTALNVYLKQADSKKAGVTSIVDSELEKQIKAGLEKYKLKNERKGNKWRADSVYDMLALHKNGLISILNRVYSFAAHKLITLYPKMNSTSIGPLVLYMVLGKTSTKIPAALKAALPRKVLYSTDGKPLEKATVDPLIAAVGLFDLTVPLIKKWGHDLVDRIPQMVKDELKGVLTTSKIKVPKTTSSKYGSSYQRMRNQRLRTEAKKSASVPKLYERMKKELPAEIVTFIKALVPTFGRDVEKFDQKVDPKLKAAKDEYDKLTAKLHVTWGTSRVTLKKKIAAARVALKQAKAAAPAPGGVDAKPWMMPYLNSTITVNISGRSAKLVLGDGMLTHRLITRANLNKLKPGDPELTASVDDHNSALLTLQGLDNIINDALGGDSIKAFKTIFKNCIEEVKPKAYAMALFKGSGSTALDTGIGKVKNKRVLQLNNISEQQVKDFTKTYDKDIKAWNPLKMSLKDTVTKVKNSVSKEAKMEVRPATKAEFAAWAADIPNYMAGIHGVTVNLQKAWAVKQSAQIAAILKNAAKSKVLKVIPNVFHGCPKPVAGAILTFGFKLSGTKTNGRSMGDALYMAPNIDKSAQYLGTSFTRKEGASGIVFMGDCLVAGAPKSHQKGVADKSRSYKWTKSTGFATEEIGLVSPNNQFIVRRVLQIKIGRDNRSHNNAPRPGLRPGQRRATPTAKHSNPKTRFADPIPIATYLSTLTAAAAPAAAPVTSTGRKPRASRTPKDGGTVNTAPVSGRKPRTPRTGSTPSPVTPVKAPKAGSVLQGQTVGFTGVRDTALETRITANGGAVSNGVTKATTILIAKDPAGTSRNLEKARAQGVKIMNMTQFLKKYPI